MAVTLNANTSTGFIATSDTSGVLQLQTGGTTALAVSAAQVVTLTNPLPVASGGSGGTTSTGTGANVLGTTPSFTSTIGVGNATPSASGAGITFPSGVSHYSSDVNTLDDYEEGTWTPTVGGTWTTNPTSLSGSYVKVGKVVTLNIVFINGAKSTAISGWIGGLPFVTVTNGGGTCVDSDITNRGLCYTGNDTRVWYTNTAFSTGGNAAQITYYV
jgi:hypothetical protein